MISLRKLVTGIRKRALPYRHRNNADRRGLPHHDQQYTGPFADGPWGDIEKAFSYHKRDSTPREHLNRRAQEEAARLGERDLPWLDEDSSSAVYEDWPVARLAELPRAHERDLPRDESTPVVILQIDTKAALLDGHTRVNKWAKEPGGGARRVVVVRPKVEA
jgi:hypothetical protein